MCPLSGHGYLRNPRCVIYSHRKLCAYRISIRLCSKTLLLQTLPGGSINTVMTRNSNSRPRQSKSLLNYIENSGGFIDRNAPLTKEPDAVTPERPVLTIAKKADVVENAIVEQPVLTEQTDLATPIQETVSIAPVLAEQRTFETITQQLQESIDSLKTTLVEQQNTQVQLANLIGELFESVAKHNQNIDQRFDAVNTMFETTSRTLLETTEKLAEISTRDITVPAPVVNVSLPEQKKIVKTVDRDSNGLIRQITEQTE